MTALIAFALISLVLLCLLLWLHGRLTGIRVGQVSARVPVDFLVPRKPEEFTQAREALAKIQSEIAQKHIPSEERRQLLQERNKLALELLKAIHEDFVRLDRLMCAVAAVAPQISRQRELERLWLSLRFDIRYRIALLSISLGAMPAHAIPALQIFTKRRAKNLQMLLKAVDSSLSMRHAN